MLAGERKSLILQAIATDGRVLASELSQKFGVSEDTIRRDLRELAGEGLLHRVHGGALPKMPMVPEYTQRRAESIPIKSQIGATASQLVRQNQAVIIDGGTTPREVAAHLAAEWK